jgi:hypothetical protein
MSEEINYGTFTVAEVWQPSVRLRFVDRLVDDFTNSLVGSTYSQKTIKILQQLHTNSLGNQKWIDVPTELE